MPELEEILEVERLSAVLRKGVYECVEDMKSGLSKVGSVAADSAVSSDTEGHDVLLFIDNIFIFT